MSVKLGHLLRMLIWLAVLCLPTLAQDLPEFENGLKPFGAYHGGDIDSVSLVLLR